MLLYYVVIFIELLCIKLVTQWIWVFLLDTSKFFQLNINIIKMHQKLNFIQISDMFRMFKYYIATMLIPWKVDKNLKSHFQMHSILRRIICLFKATSSTWSYESVECGSLEISNGTSCLSAAVVNTPTKATWGRKVFILIYRS